MIQCPRCGAEVTELHAGDADFRLKAEASGEKLPEQVCVGCISDLRKMIAASSGGYLLAQERAKENHRLSLWNNRVPLIKQARTYMTNKKFSEAAVAYEKYLRILEIVFECKNGDKLRPEVFKDTARTSEITVVACVYWDLVRIYDSHERYASRQLVAANQLAKFIQFTPIFYDIVKRAQSFQRQAKNPSAVKAFLKEAAVQRPRCFIATSAYGDITHPDVLFLRQFRDQYLKKSFLGRKFIFFYYRYSPRIADVVESRKCLRCATKSILTFFVLTARFFLAKSESR
ncbi:MAG: CFI-box-CTERM domain-containing protein [Pseudobdellovibrionaceae bacterium]